MRVDGLPDEVVDRHLDEVGNNSGVVPQPVSECIDEADASEGPIETGQPQNGGCGVLAPDGLQICRRHHPTSPLR